MGIKKIARPINRAKNHFVKWLKDNNARLIDVYESKEEDWDYYAAISAFVGRSYYSVYFQMWQGEVKIDYSDDENRYKDMSIDEFMQLIS